MAYRDSTVGPRVGRLPAGQGKSGARRALWLGLLSAVMVLAGCGSSGRTASRAPVVDRSDVRTTAAVDAGTSAPAVVALPGQENAGKPGYYTVRPGDTLTRIGLETGQSRRDLAAWNNLSDPNRIEVGQVLRVVPPVAAAAGASTPVQAAAANGPASTAPVGGEPRGQGRPLSAGNGAPAAPAAAVPLTAASGDEIAFAWPGTGAILERFEEPRNKGIDLAGRAGDPVLAAADGRVIYAGSGIRGLGNLIILKHNNTYLTAYAHNQTLLVKEDQTVRQGQKIAEMGSSDADRVKLHFEVRRQGKPVDPLKFLPAR